MNICYKILRNVAAAFGALALMAQGVVAQDLPADIQKGNILHCFDWTMNDVKDALPQIVKRIGPKNGCHWNLLIKTQK